MIVLHVHYKAPRDFFFFDIFYSYIISRNSKHDKHKITKMIDASGVFQIAARKRSI